MWDFLSRCYQHAMKMSNMYKEKSSSSMTDGLSRVSTAASSLSMNGIDPNKPIMVSAVAIYSERKNHYFFCFSLIEST